MSFASVTPRLIWKVLVANVSKILRVGHAVYSNDGLGLLLPHEAKTSRVLAVKRKIHAWKPHKCSKAPEPTVKAETHCYFYTLCHYCSANSQ